MMETQTIAEVLRQLFNLQITVAGEYTFALWEFALWFGIITATICFISNLAHDS